MLTAPNTALLIRSGQPDDASALAQVYRESWQHAYRGIIPARHLDVMTVRRDADWWRKAVGRDESLLVLEVAKRIGGYASWGTSRLRCPFQGEIYELYLTPEFQGLGLGEHLFEACRHRMDMRRLKGLIVWALAANSPATDFYWRQGGRPTARVFVRIGGQKLEKVAFGWP